MSSPIISDVEKIEINPLNQPAFGYSFRGGFPIVQFEISAQDKLLVGSSVRLNGTLRVQQSASTEEVPVLVNNGANKGGAVFDCAMSSRVGVASAISQITLSSSTRQTLEVVRGYNRYLSTVQGVTLSGEDLDTNTQQQSLTASRSFNGAKGINNDVDFSIPLRTGLLSGGNPLSLGQNGLRGLVIQLDLAPDANVLGPYFEYATGTEVKKNDSATGQGAFYQLRDLTLSYDLLVPDADSVGQMLAQTAGQLEYNSVSHLYSVVNASDQTQNLNLGTSKTLSITHNMIPTTHINNYQEDGMSTNGLFNQVNGTYTIPAPIKQVSFSKGGILFPIDNIIDVEFNNPGRTDENRPKSELNTNFINSIKPYSMMNHSLMSLNTENGLSTDVALDGADVSPFTQADPRGVFGIGVSTDPYKVGVDYSNTNYALRIQSALNGRSPNSIFTYVMAKNVLTWSPAGILVQS